MDIAPLHEWPSEWNFEDLDRDAFLAEVKAEMREEWLEEKRDIKAEEVYNARLKAAKAEEKAAELHAIRNTNELKWPVPMPQYVLNAARDFNRSCQKIYLNTTDERDKEFFQGAEKRLVELFATSAYTAEMLWLMYQKMFDVTQAVSYGTMGTTGHSDTGGLFKDVRDKATLLSTAMYNANRAHDRLDRASDGIADVYHYDQGESSDEDDEEFESDDETYDGIVEYDGVQVQCIRGKWGRV